MTKFVNDDESYAFLVIDDGTETIRAKFFQDLSMYKKVEEGQLVRIIGKIREYEGEIYINPEIVKSVDDPNYLALHLSDIVRSLKQTKENRERLDELKKENPDNYGEMLADEIGEDKARALLRFESSGEETEKEQKEKSSDGELKKEVLGIIDELDEGEGASYQDIIDEIDAEEKKIDEVINDLLTEGTCFEPRPGRIKKL
jgi:RPA family protein